MSHCVDVCGLVLHVGVGVVQVSLAWRVSGLCVDVFLATMCPSLLAACVYVYVCA